MGAASCCHPLDVIRVQMQVWERECVLRDREVCVCLFLCVSICVCVVRVLPALYLNVRMRAWIFVCMCYLNR